MTNAVFRRKFMALNVSQLSTQLKKKSGRASLSDSGLAVCLQSRVLVQSLVRKDPHVVGQLNP